jgi:hypothetical protein
VEKPLASVLVEPLPTARRDLLDSRVDWVPVSLKSRSWNWLGRRLDQPTTEKSYDFARMAPGLRILPSPASLRGWFHFPTCSDGAPVVSSPSARTFLKN